MILTKIYTFTIAANQSYNLPVVGKFFKIQAASGAVDVTAPGFQLQGVGTGQGLGNVDFLGLQFQDKSGASNTLSVIVGDSNFIDSLNGSVAVTTTPFAKSSGAFMYTRTITTTSGALLAFNAARQGVQVQNKDPSGAVWIGIGTVTQANGIRVGPGEVWEPPLGAIPNSAFNAIGDIASNANIVILEV